MGNGAFGVGEVEVGLDVTADHASFFEVALVVLLGLPEDGTGDDLCGDGQPVGS